ncbi:MAG: DNA starvation/stationary phase protection protein [Planctomycetes bacterium]|nr:DNA starvation/stationary phase protection protein [Planctomycetota bacterium]
MKDAKSAKHAARATAAVLAPALADLIDLSLACKQAHWNLEGPFFSPLHALFDAMTDEYRAWYDEVAERLLALGVPADGRSSTVAAKSRVEEMPSGRLPGPKAVEAMTERVESLAKRLRGDLDRLGDLDPVSQDMVIGILAGVEKQAWMLRVQNA